MPKNHKCSIATGVRRDYNVSGMSACSLSGAGFGGIQMTKTKRRTLTAALLMGIMFLACIFALQGILLNYIIDCYSLTDSAQGLASAASSVGAAAALIASFFLIGRMQKLTLLKFSVVLCVVFLVFLKFSPGFALFVGIWGIVGVGMGFIDMLLSSCMADLYEGRAATRMMCILHMSYGAMATVAPFVYTQFLTHGMHWTAIYLCAAVFGSAVFAVLFLSSRDMPAADSQIALTEKKMGFREMASVLTKGTLPGLIFAVFTQGLFIGGMNTWVNRFVGVTLSSSLGSTAHMLFFFGIMASRLAVPFLPFRPEKYVRTAGLIAGALVLAVLPFATAPVMCAASLISGLIFGAMLPCMLNIGCDATPESTMFATTVLMLALYAGQGSSPPLVGAIESAFGLHTGIAVCAVALIISSVCCLLTKFPRLNQN